MNKSYKRLTYKKKGRKRVVKKNKRNTKKIKRRVGGARNGRGSKSPPINIPANENLSRAEVLNRGYQIGERMEYPNNGQKASKKLRNQRRKNQQAANNQNLIPRRILKILNPLMNNYIHIIILQPRSYRRLTIITTEI